MPEMRGVVEKENREDSGVSHPELDEVMSPELVLVDPELARLARQRLCEAPERRPQPRPIAAFRP